MASTLCHCGRFGATWTDRDTDRKVTACTDHRPDKIKRSGAGIAL